MVSRLKKEDEYHGVDDATMLLEPILFMNYVLVNCWGLFTENADATGHYTEYMYILTPSPNSACYNAKHSPWPAKDKHSS